MTFNREILGGGGMILQATPTSNIGGGYISPPAIDTHALEPPKLYIAHHLKHTLNVQELGCGRKKNNDDNDPLILCNKNIYAALCLGENKHLCFVLFVLTWVRIASHVQSPTPDLHKSSSCIMPYIYIVFGSLLFFFAIKRRTGICGYSESTPSTTIHVNVVDPRRTVGEHSN